MSARPGVYRWLLVSWAGLVVPFVAATLAGRLVPHPIYHLVYLAVTIGTLGSVLRLCREVDSPRVRALVFAVAAMVIAVLLGHIDQEIVVFTHGGFHASMTVWTNPYHLAGAYLALAALLISQPLLFATLILIRRENRELNAPIPD
jgi:hypothetical protein